MTRTYIECIEANANTSTRRYVIRGGETVAHRRFASLMPTICDGFFAGASPDTVPVAW